MPQPLVEGPDRVSGGASPGRSASSRIFVPRRSRRSSRASTRNDGRCRPTPAMGSSAPMHWASGRWKRRPSKIEKLRALATRDGGNLILSRCPTEWKERLRVWGEPRADWAIARTGQGGPRSSRRHESGPVRRQLLVRRQRVRREDRVMTAQRLGLEAKQVQPSLTTHGPSHYQRAGIPRFDQPYRSSPFGTALSRRLGPGPRQDAEDQLALADGRPLLDPRGEDQLPVGRRVHLAACDVALQVLGLRRFQLPGRLPGQLVGMSALDLALQFLGRLIPRVFFENSSLADRLLESEESLLEVQDLRRSSALS